MLSCEAKGEKPIGILWNMNNKRLDSQVDPRYTVREETITDGWMSTISIKRTERGDSALFTCVATNAFGSDDTSINLIIQEVDFSDEVGCSLSYIYILENFANSFRTAFAELKLSSLA